MPVLPTCSCAALRCSTQRSCGSKIVRVSQKPWKACSVALRPCLASVCSKPQMAWRLRPQVGVFHEAALQRYDYVLAAAGLIGIRLILCVQNHWDVRSHPNELCFIPEQPMHDPLSSRSKAHVCTCRQKHGLSRSGVLSGASDSYTK